MSHGLSPRGPWARRRSAPRQASSRCRSAWTEQRRSGPAGRGRARHGERLVRRPLAAPYRIDRAARANGLRPAARPEDAGVAHPVLPCGVKFYIRVRRQGSDPGRGPRARRSRAGTSTSRERLPTGSASTGRSRSAGVSPADVGILQARRAPTRPPARSVLCDSSTCRAYAFQYRTNTAAEGAFVQQRRCAGQVAWHPPVSQVHSGRRSRRGGVSPARLHV